VYYYPNIVKEVTKYIYKYNKYNWNKLSWYKLYRKINIIDMLIKV
jgi:hypothetical protein